MHEVNKKNIESVIFKICFATILVLNSFSLIGQPTNKDEPLEKLRQITEEIDNNLHNSSQQIEIGNFENARDLNQKTLTQLEQLADIFMPLPDRIKELIQSEEIILDGTRDLASDMEQNQKVDQEAKQTLTHDQIKNRDSTIKTVGILEQQLKSGEIQAHSTDKGKKGNQEQQKKLLREIQSLLNSAYAAQDQASGSLNRSDFTAAIPAEKRSIEDLKKALEKLSKKSQQNKKQKSDQQQNQQNPDKEKEANRENKTDTNTQESKDKKQLSPEEALKELAKLRKRAKEEKKRREDVYGKVAIPDRAQVDKDW